MRVDERQGVADGDRDRLQQHLGELIRARDYDALAVRGGIEVVYEQRYTGSDLESSLADAVLALDRAAKRHRLSVKAVNDFLDNPRLP